MIYVQKYNDYLLVRNRKLKIKMIYLRLASDLLLAKAQVNYIVNILNKRNDVGIFIKCKDIHNYIQCLNNMKDE